MRLRWSRRLLPLAGLLAVATALPYGFSRVSGVAATPAPDLRGTGGLRVDFIDVGHGDAALITSPAGKTVLIDGGFAQQGDVVAAFVAARTRAPIDLVLLTHRHADHLGGLTAVIARQGARTFMDAAYPHPSPAYDALMRLLDQRRIPVRTAQRGRIVDLGGGARLVLLTPPEPVITGSRSDVNANSVVARLEWGRSRVLLTGDAEAVTEDWLLDSNADVRADVLKLAHHGSRHSSTARFLRAVSPQVAIASSGPATQPGAGTGAGVGARAGGGRIHSDTARRVEHTGARLYRTDIDGNITVWIDGAGIKVQTQKDQL